MSPERATEMGNSYMNTSKLNVANISKHMLLYEDAMQRNMRHEVIYSKSIDKECTFKPNLVTK